MGDPAVRALFVFVCGCVLLLSAQLGMSRAGLEPKARVTAMELIVFEHPDCIYCAVFRRDVAPSYQRSAPGDRGAAALCRHRQERHRRAAPEGGHRHGADRRAHEERRGSGRISGYWGREGFFKMLAHIRSTAE